MKSWTLRRSIIAATGAAVVLAASHAAAQTAQPTLEGTWRVTRHGVDCVTGEVRNSFPAIMVFHNGGTYSGFGASPGSTPADGSPEYGIWQRAPGMQNYTFRITGIAYDGATVAGSVEITGDAELSQQGQRLDYTATIAFLDTSGNQLFAFCGKASGVRFQ
jgi:hypothetical protein